MGIPDTQGLGQTRQVYSGTLIMTEIVEHFLTGIMAVGFVAVYYSINFSADQEDSDTLK